MNDKDNFINLLDTQPISNILREHLPINYFLFSLVTKYKEEELLYKVASSSSFHNTTEYIIIPFYKSLSNIL